MALKTKGQPTISYNHHFNERNKINRLEWDGQHLSINYEGKYMHTNVEKMKCLGFWICNSFFSVAPEQSAY